MKLIFVTDDDSNYDWLIVSLRQQLWLKYDMD